MRRSLLILSFLVLWISLANGALVINSDITTDTTLLMSNNPHQIRGNIRVLDGVTLTVQPGVNIFFENGSSLTIEGQISAMGSSEQPIQFTSLEWQNFYTRLNLSHAEGSTFFHCSIGRSDDNTALLKIEYSGTINLIDCNLGSSSGHGIYINNSTVNIDDCHIGNVGNHGVYIGSSSAGSSVVSIQGLTVDGCNSGVYIPSYHFPAMTWAGLHIYNSRSYPLYAGMAQYHVLGSVFVSDVNPRMLAIWDSNVYGNYTLQSFGVPYYLVNAVTIGNGYTLTLEPGVGLRFPEYGILSFGGNSTLNAVGTEALPITFYSAGAHNWKCINLESGCNASLDWCDFNHCGYPQYGYPEPAIRGTNINSLSISNTTIPGGTTDGIYLTGSNTGTLTLNNVSIEDCPGTGLFILNNSLSLEYQNLSISDCGRPLAIPGNLLNFLDEAITLEGNTDTRFFVHNNGYLYRDTTIRNWDYPYCVENIDINVNYANLVIEPGTEIQFGYSFGFYVNGTISAVGTAEEPILFTRHQGATQNWRGFYLGGGTSNAHFDHCVLEHCASSNQYGHIQDAFTIYRADTVLIENSQISDAYCRGIFIESSDSNNDDITIRNVSITGCGMDGVYQQATDYNLTIDGLSISGCNSYPLSYSANWAHQVQNLTLTGNTHNLIRFVNGGYLASQTLTNHGYPYLVSGAVLCVHYTNVTLQPGTVFYLENERSIEVYGSLTAIGTETEPIIFTRMPGSTGYWQNILLRNGSSSTFRHCQFSYGGMTSPYGYDTALIQNSGATSVIMEDCQILSVQAQGIACSEIGTGDSMQINRVLIDGCGTDGFWCNDSDLTLSLNNLTIQNCGRNPISILPQQASSLQALTLTNNTNNNIRLFGYNGIYGQLHFANLGYIYRCEEGISGNSGSSISFAPGCMFWIADNRYLDFNGAVSAIGTAEQPITFTRYPSSTNNWIGIRLYGSSWDADFAWCHILYAGAQETYGNRRAILNNGASNVSISNCLIQNSFGDGFVCAEIQSSDVQSIANLSITDAAAVAFVCNVNYHDLTVNGLEINSCGSYPIYSNVELLDRFTGVQITNPGTPYIGLGMTTLYHSSTWPNFGLPYRTAGTITVYDWQTLTLVAGTEIVFDDYVLYQNSPSLMIHGALNVQGSMDHPVTLRGVNPESPSTWLGLRIYNPDAICNLNYLTILNAGLDENHTPNEEFTSLYINNGTVNLTGCRIALSNHNLLKLESNNTTTLTGCQLDSAGGGIIQNAGTLNLVNNTITAISGTGIYHAGGTLNFGSSPAQWNRIYGNNLNLRNNTMQSKTAPYVYWGSIDPAVIDGTIYDDEEGTGLVNFEPWYDEACLNLYSYTLDTPQNPVLELVSDTLLQFSWSAVTGADHYRVLVSTDPYAVDWSILADNIEGCLHEISLNPGEAIRFYRVMAVR